MKKRWLNASGIVKAYRHVYRYTCGKCGRIRFTYDKVRHDMGECTKCEPEKVDPNQSALPL